MQKLRRITILLLVALVVAFSVTLLVACDDDSTTTDTENPSTPKKDITGVTFTDARVNYDGQEHELTVSGTIPEGVSVKYDNNKGTETGEYKATATLTGEGYNTLTLKATLTIVGNDITGITFADGKFPYDKQEHSIVITGELPEGVSVKYENNKATDYGEYTATATLTGKGYNTLTLTAKLTIEAKDITGVTFANVKITYDGNEHSIQLVGELPEGVTPNITGDTTGTDAGTYNATAELWGVGYKPLTLKATLTIDPAEITGVTLTGDRVVYDKQPHSITVAGTLPAGVSVSYTYNGQAATDATLVGSHTVVATLSGKNYVTKTLSATLTIDNRTITGVEFNDITLTYNGNEQEIVVTGEVPEDADVSYSHNKGTTVGTYDATATISGYGYNTLTLEATLTIDPADITGVTLSNASFDYDTLVHSIQVVGNVPAGVTTVYYYDGEVANGVSEVGKHEVKAVLSGDNYNTLTLTATLTIKASEEMLYSAFFGGYVYFQNSLDGNKLYRATSSGNPAKVSNDVATYFTSNSSSLYFYSGGLLTQTIKSLSGTTVKSEFNPGRATYLACDDNGNLYYAKANAIDTKHENGIYKVKISDDEPTPVRLTTDKADYIYYYDGFIYYCNNTSGSRLYRIGIDQVDGTGQQLTEEKVSDIIVDGGCVYYTEHSGINATICQYNISSKQVTRLCIDNGAYLTKIDDYIYYVNKDLLTSNIFGKGIYRVSVDGAFMGLVGQKVLEVEDGNGYYSLATDGSNLYYYKLNDKHFYRYNISDESETDLMRNFQVVEDTSLSSDPYSFLASYNGELYYTNPLDGNSLYKYNPQTKAIYKVISNSVSNVFFHDGYMYYSTYVNLAVVKNYALWKIKLNDQEAEPIKISSHRYENLIFVGDDIYAIRVSASLYSNHLVKLSPPQGDDTTLYTETELFANKNLYITKLYLVDGTFHFTINPFSGSENIYTCDLESGNTVDIGVRSNNFVISGDKYYYFDQGGTLGSGKGFKSCGLDGQNSTTITSGIDITDIYLYNGVIYYTSTTNNNAGIFAYDIEQGTTTKLTDKVGHGFYVLDGNLYFINVALTYSNDYPSAKSGDGHLYSIDLTSNQLTKIV